MKKILILGVGSPFADDQFGWAVTDKLLELLPNSNKENIVIDSADRPGLNLLNYLDSDYERIIIVDAVFAKTEPGTLFVLRAEEIVQFEGFLSSHSVGVAPSLALAQAVGMNISNVEVYGAEGERLGEKDDMISDSCKVAIDKTTKILAERFL